MSLKILHLSSERSWRGGEQQIAYLLHESERSGVNVSVAVKAGSEFEKYCINKNIAYYPLPFSNSMDFRTALALKKICKSLKPDLVHLHSSKSHGIAVLSSMLGNNTPLVLSRRVDFVPKDSWFTRFKYNHKSIRRIICVSEKINEIVRAYIQSPEKSVTVHSGIDINKFSNTKKENVLRTEYDLNSDHFIVGNTSALEGHKDYFTFINTIAELKSRLPNIRAFIIGSGSLEADLRKHTQDLNVSDVVYFTGFRKDIIDVISSLDLFLMTSNEEGLGTSVLDAFAARVPVVATRAGGIPEMVIDGETGLLAPIADAKTLAANVERVVNDKALRDRLVQNAFKRLTDHFTKEQTALKTIAVYREILRS